MAGARANNKRRRDGHGAARRIVVVIMARRALQFYGGARLSSVNQRRLVSTGSSDKRPVGIDICCSGNKHGDNNADYAACSQTTSIRLGAGRHQARALFCCALRRGIVRTHHLTSAPAGNPRTFHTLALFSFKPGSGVAAPGILSPRHLALFASSTPPHLTLT